MTTGPFGPKPAGRLNASLEAPTGSFIFWDPVPQRIRAFIGGEPLVDSRKAVLLHETGQLPVYYFPQDDVRMDLLEPTDHTTHCPHKGEASYWTIRVGRREEPNAVWSYREPLEPVSFIAGWMSVYWDLVDEWFAEDAQLHGHPRDPYHRIDVYPTTRHVRILLDGEVLADTRRAIGLFETGLPTRWYVPPEDVRTELLEPSAKKTRCAYKGSASYWNVRVGDRVEEDIVWTYTDPERDAQLVRDMFCFFAEHTDLELDGEPVPRPQTQWSR